ncbi:MAG: hypothetical protein JXC85_04010 [Candidatus Aenigmarchaeota archaeon]|nr:hypothetical protein [Candidatus Aenigmarchaeota archaeon]
MRYGQSGKSHLLSAHEAPNGDFLEFRASYVDQGTMISYDSFFPVSKQGPSVEGPSGCLHMPGVKAINLDGEEPLPVEVVDFMQSIIKQLPQMRMAFVSESDYRPSQRKQPKVRDPLASQRYDVLRLAELCADVSS